MGNFEIFMDIQGVFHWRLKDPNGEIIASSEGYLSKQACQNGISGVKQFAPTAEVVDVTHKMQSYLDLTLPPFGK